MMKRLLPFVLLAGAMSPFACAAPPAPLDDRQALIETLLERMTLAEKIGQLRLISIGGDMPRERSRDRGRPHRCHFQFGDPSRQPPHAGRGLAQPTGHSDLLRL